jgi:AcrR family transcriptional regulator
MEAPPPNSGKRERNRADVRRRIEDAMLEALTAGEPGRLNHAGLAEAVGVSRRTVYRHFPDKDALMKGLWHRTNRAIGTGFPRSADEVLARLEPAYRGFDANAAAMTVAMSTPEGRAVRNAMKAERDAGWRKALAGEVAALPERDRTMVLGVIQLLSTGLAWRELRDQWDLDGGEIATACRWAISTLLADLAKRGGRPLDSDWPAPPSAV